MKNEVLKSLKVIQQAQILLYPTDTVWGIGCDATSQVAVNEVFKIKQRKVKGFLNDEIFQLVLF